MQPRDALARSLKSARHCLLVEGPRLLRRRGGAGASQSARRLRANRALRHGPRAHHGSRCWASGRRLRRRRILGGAAWRRCLASDGAQSTHQHKRTRTSQLVPRRLGKDGPSSCVPGAHRAGRGPRRAGGARRVHRAEGGSRGIPQGHERRRPGRRPHAGRGPLGPDRLLEAPREHPGLGARRRRAVAAVDARGRDQARPRTLRRPSPFDLDRAPPRRRPSRRRRRSRCSRSRARSSSRTACTSTAS